MELFSRLFAGANLVDANSGMSTRAAAGLPLMANGGGPGRIA